MSSPTLKSRLSNADGGSVRIGAGTASRAVKAVAVAGAGAALALGAALTPANASTTDAHLVATASQGGACSGTASADWARQSNTLLINSSAHSSYLFAGCRLKVVLTFWAGTYQVTSYTHAIPTACALSDPTCPSTVYETFRASDVVVGFAVPFVDHVTAQVTGR